MTLNTAGGLSPIGQISSLDSVIIKKNGSGTFGAGPYSGLFNAAASAGILMQLNAANGIDWRDVATSTVLMTLDISGQLLNGIGAAAVAPANGFCTISPATATAIAIGHANGTAGASIFANFAYNAGTIGSITQSGTTAVLFNTTSDYRIKTLNGFFERSGEIIDAVPVHSGVFTADGGDARPLFLAHEVAEGGAGWAVTGAKDAITVRFPRPEEQVLQHFNTIEERIAALPVRDELQQLSEGALVATLWAEVRKLRVRLSQAGIP